MKKKEKLKKREVKNSILEYFKILESPTEFNFKVIISPIVTPQNKKVTPQNQKSYTTSSVLDKKEISNFSMPSGSKRLAKSRKSKKDKTLNP